MLTINRFAYTARSAAAILVLAIGVSAYAQSATDGTTPPAIAPGSPAGSYTLSGIDTVNLYSGKVNVAIPVRTIRGRGDAAFTVTYPIQRNWTIHQLDNSDGSVSLVPTTDILSDLSSFDFFGPGHLTLRSAAVAGAAGLACTTTMNIVQPGANNTILTRLTWAGSDGTETELVDVLNGGKDLPNSGSCSNLTGSSRGKVFVSTDGSSLTFISSTTIYDSVYLAPTSGSPPDGWLFFPDGTRYTMTAGNVTQIRDRNGNEINLCTAWNGCSGAVTATDSLGRTTTFTRVPGMSGQDTIAFPGYNGTQRTVTVSYAPFSTTTGGQTVSYLASGQSLSTFGCLFPELNGSSGTDFNPSVITSISLPNGRSYGFLYTSYGEVAQVTLPTGGVIQYEYGGLAKSTGSCANSMDGGTSGVITDGLIVRRVYSRKVRPAGPTGPIEQWTNYAVDYGSGSGSNTTATVQHMNSAGTAILSQEKHYFYSSPVWPLLDPTNPTHYTPWQEGKEFKTDFLDGSSPAITLRSIANTWSQRTCGAYPQDTACWFTTVTNSPNSVSSVSAPTAPTHYTVLAETDTTLSDSSQVTQTTYLYDQYNNRTDIYEADYDGLAVPFRHTSRTFVTGGYDGYDASTPATSAASIHLRDLLSTETVTDGSGNTASQLSLLYDNTALTDRGSLSGHDSGYGTSYATRGNITTKQSFILAGSSVASHFQYDTLGNVVTVTDGKGTDTSISYSAPDFAFPKSTSKSVGGTTLAWSKTYDLSTGQVTSFSDPNCPPSTCTPSSSNSTFYTAFDANGQNLDPLERVQLVTRPDGGRTQFLYNDSNLTVTTLTDQTTQDGKLAAMTIFDRLGRQIQSMTFEDGVVAGTNYISTEQTFDALGRPYQTSLPHRYVATPACGSTTHCSTTNYDALGRPKSVVTDDGATTSMTYTGNTTYVTDQSGNVRGTKTDSAGRIMSVIEAGSVTTSYRYSASNNLLAVCQAGTFGANNTCTNGQGRQFSYDWLGQLTSATNPETSATNQPSGTIQYTSYDANGNLLSKTDSQSIVTTMTYDELNRVLTKSYSGVNSAPAVTYCYDGKVATPGGGSCIVPTTSIPKALGHLTQVYSSVSATTYAGFDVMGRITASSQNTGGATYPFGSAIVPGYTYNLAGQLISETYPSGRIVAYEFDAAGRTAHVKNPASGGTVYADLSSFNPSASQYAYAPNGGIQVLGLGNGVTESWTWDPLRLQPTQMQVGSLLTLQYFYCPSGGSSCSSNNGNMQRQKITTPALGAITQDYTYADGFNRLTSATETSAGGLQTWQQKYQYDNYGNRAVVSGYVPYSAQTPGALSQFVESINGAAVNRNRWTGAGYDGAGNLTTLPQRTYTYDAENRLVASTQPGTTAAIGYAYDGNGQRVQKTVGTAVTTYVYDASGQLAAEYGPPTDTGTIYLSADHLGSTRLVQTSSGTVQARYDYWPFGEDIPSGMGGRDATYPSGVYPATGADVESLKFTGKERDAETGLDYFGARYFSAAQGRWTSPDAPLADQWEKDPQSWNLYSYVRNNPLRFTDLTGRECVTLDGGAAGDNGKGKMCQAVLDADKKKKPDVTVTAKGGNAVVAFGLNFLFALDNAANAWFSPLTKAMGVTPSYMQDTPTNNEGTGKLAAGVEFLGEMALGPGEERAALKLIHSSETLSKTILEGLRKKSTQEIIETLKPGVEEALRVKPDGRVMNGNHRITVLMERGVNVNALPREIVK